MIPDLKKKFAGIQKDHSPEPRPFYCHFTSVIDTRSTKLILLSGRPWFSLNAFWCWAHAFPSSPRHDFTSQFEKELLNGMSRTKPLLSASHILMACVIVTVVNTRYSFHLLTILRASSHGPPQRNGSSITNWCRTVVPLPISTTVYCAVACVVLTYTGNTARWWFTLRTSPVITRHTNDCQEMAWIFQHSVQNT